MDFIVNYVVESCLSLGILSLFYLVFLRKSQLIGFKRIYLLGAVLLAALIPLGNIQLNSLITSSQVYNPVAFYALETATIYADDVSDMALPAVEQNNWIAWFYMLGGMLLLTRLLVGLIRIGLMGRKFKSVKQKLFRLFITDGKFHPFSFFHWVFISRYLWEDGKTNVILAHEKEHAAQWHSLDVMILELLLIVQWFNPFIWLVRKEMKENHEFLADRAVLKSGISRLDYLQAMLLPFVGSKQTFGNNFSLSTTQKRLKMMKSNNSEKHNISYIGSSLLLFLIVAFVFTVDFTAIAQEVKDDFKEITEDKKVVGEEVFVVVERMPQYPGGFQALKKDLLKRVKKAKRKVKGEAIGQVKLNLTISEKGKVTNVKAQKGSPENLTAMVASALAKCKDWKPGEQRGRKVPVDYAMLIDFKTDGAINFDGLKVRAKPMLVNEQKVSMANGKIEVSGTVTDKNKRPIQGASVVVTDKTAKFMQGTITSADGSYKLELDKKHPELVVSFIGYKTRKIDIFNKSAKSKVGEDKVFMVVEEMPKFPGGDKALMKFLATNVKYPAKAREQGVQGRVFVSYVIKKDGSVEDISIARGVDPALDEEAMRVVKDMPNWEPGKQRGKKVNVKYMLPINFVLQGGDNKKHKANSKDENHPDEIVVVSAGKDKEPDNIFMVVEQMPEFPGGQDSLIRFLSKNVRYPAKAQEFGTQGKVFVSFIVDKAGPIRDVEIARSVSPELDAEALRVVKIMPNWKPGVQRGKKVNVKYMLPINFTLQGNKRPSIQLEIGSKDKIVVNGKSVSLDELSAAMKAIVEKDKKHSKKDYVINLKVDSGVKIESVSKVKSKIREFGILKINAATKKEKVTSLWYTIEDGIIHPHHLIDAVVTKDDIAKTVKRSLSKNEKVRVMLASRNSIDDLMNAVHGIRKSVAPGKSIEIRNSNSVQFNYNSNRTKQGKPYLVMPYLGKFRIPSLNKVFSEKELIAFVEEELKSDHLSIVSIVKTESISLNKALEKIFKRKNAEILYQTSMNFEKI